MRKSSHLLQHLPLNKTLWRVQLEQADGCSAYWRYTDNSCCLDSKMFSPFLGTGIKQPDQFTGKRIKRGKVCPLVQIAVQTGKSHIFLRCWSTMLEGNYMIDWVGEGRIVLVE
jgi:hypothetical protein